MQTKILQDSGLEDNLISFKMTEAIDSLYMILLCAWIPDFCVLNFVHLVLGFVKPYDEALMPTMNQNFVNSEKLTVLDFSRKETEPTW